MNKLKENLSLIFALILFLLLTLPFITTLPYMDGNIDFVQTLDFYTGGINQYFSNWNTVHPPLKLFLISPFYLLFGVSAASYSVIGIIIGILGVISIYYLTKNLFGRNSANLAAIFFSLSPLFIANSIFSMRDSLLTVFMLISLLFYNKQKFQFYAVLCSLAILTKETGLLLPLIVIFIEVASKIKNRKINLKKDIPNFILISLPLLIYYIWRLFLSSHGKNSWNEWIFTENESKSAIFTIINNLISLDFINPYAIQHWEQFVFLNFNWVYILVIIFGVGIYLVKRKKSYFYKNSQNIKTLSIILLFIISYLLSVLSLQTYTIPRYALPLIPFLVIGLAKSVTILKNIYLRYVLTSFVFILISISLFLSIDPVATHIWGKTNIFGNKIYALNDHLAGNDGITYNMQYLLIAKERSEIINKTNNNGQISSEYCRWVFPDPNNESKMIDVLNIKIELSCIQIN